MIDPILVTVLQKRLEGISDEMGLVMRKTAYSPNIKERADFSCAIFDDKARLIAQAAAIPVHLGSMGFVAKPILEKYKDKWSDGDAIIVNSPRGEFGGTHLPDITLVTPVFHNVEGREELQFIVANRAHHADVGGQVPGSLPGQSTEIYQEGLIIPPVRLFISGEENSDVMDLILENVRTPRERRGDLRAQYSSLLLGSRRLKDLLTDNTLTEDSSIEILINALLDKSEEATRNKLKVIPNQIVNFYDYLDSDGISNEQVKIECTLEVNNGNLIFDFTNSAVQQEGNCNAPVSITTAGVYYVVRLITGKDVPTNEGCFRSISIITAENSVVRPSYDAATSSANTETSQRIVDVVLGCVQKLDGLNIPKIAASQGTMNNVIIGNKDFTVYETIGGGSGATSTQKGTSAIHVHMTNTQNTPIEALELAYPLRIREYRIRDNSGGEAGTGFKGGDGIIRKIELLVDAKISLQTERRSLRPWGIDEGGPGKAGNNILFQLQADGSYKEVLLPGKISTQASKGDILQIETPGGGGS